MGQRIEANPELWYPFVVQFETCSIEVKIPGEGFVSVKPPERFIPTGEQFDLIASFSYDNEHFFLAVMSRKYEYKPEPFKDSDDFFSHLNFRNEPNKKTLHSGGYEWINVYSPPIKKHRAFITEAGESNFYPLTSSYALAIRADYAGKSAENTKLLASRRAITREVLANVKISGCGYYEKDRQ